MLPWILAIISDDDVLAKAFCTIAIVIRPGARNCRNGRSPIRVSARCMARAKIARNTRVETTGAMTVWVATFQNRQTSFR